MILIFKILHFTLLFSIPLLFFSGLIKYAKSKSKKRLIILVIALVIFSINYSIIRQFEKPIRLKKEEIVGEYKIDTDFYPGKNANWQYDNYSFEITNNDQFILKHSNGSELAFDITWSSGPPFLWTIKNPKHQIINRQVTLYRSHYKFYYVFNSSKWGNMFFRKVK